MNPLELAIEIAVAAHKGQTDKAGLPYILHPLRIMMRMPDQATKIVAMLHDVVEDTSVTLADLESEGFSSAILKAVDCMTHRSEDNYDAYIQRLAGNPIARLVKLGDLEDNMNILRLETIGDKDIVRLRKYRKYHRLLSNWQD